MQKSKGTKRTPATLRSTNGAGFDFEDLISAWLCVKMLTGEQVPAIGGTGVQIQAQVSSLGWHIDDLLLTTREQSGKTGRLAISAKGNLQVNAAGLPADFVTRAWAQLEDPKSPMQPEGDGLALVTLGTHDVFHPNWREVKNACSGPDMTLTVSRIRDNPGQSKIFNSVQHPEKTAPTASDEKTIELIRRLHVLPVDLDLAYSQDKAQSIAQCRQLLRSGDAAEAEQLWEELVNAAREVRLRRGTRTLQELWSTLRTKFELRLHPDFARDWETLTSITSDYKARIETGLPSGYSIPRAEEASQVEAAISTTLLTVAFGESGSGKSALLKNVLDSKFRVWTQVWFGPEELKTALSAARRGALPLKQELGRTLNAAASLKNILVIDSAEHIDPAEFGAIRQLLDAVLPSMAKIEDSAWRVVISTQTQGGIAGAEAILGANQATQVEVKPLENADVKLALRSSPSLAWLTGHDDTVAALTNLRTLAWVAKAGVALGSRGNGLTSHTAIADQLWSYWTADRVDLKALVMRLAKREASFERSFAITELDAGDTATLTPWPDKLPLHLNQRTNRIEFGHDLAADWARFQFLKQIWTDTSQWAAFAENPLWTNALRMLGQFLLRQAGEQGTAWDDAFGAAERSGYTLAGDILLDALCLDPEAERFLTERIDLLLENGATHFTRLLTRFHHIGTVPTGGVADKASSHALYMEAQYRSLVISRWPPLLRFLIAQREKLSGLVSSALAKIAKTWLTATPRQLADGTPMPFRRELANLMLAMARTVQVEKGHGVLYMMGEPLVYTATLAGAEDLPDEIGAWALELAGRRITDSGVGARIAEVLHQKSEEHRERLLTDSQYKERHERKRNISPSIGSFRRKLSPWPLGASSKVDRDFRAACFKEDSIQPLMRSRPDVAAEVLLALIIEDQPERDSGLGRHEVELGLEFSSDGYPTIFWKSPFFPFLNTAPATALTALISLVNFCTEQWAKEVMGRRMGIDPTPGLNLQLADGVEKVFVGSWDVFDWTQKNSHHHGNLFCSLDGLERWLVLQIDAGVDVTPYVAQILHEGESSALIGLLVNIGKYQPPLLLGSLAPLLTDPHIFFWDRGRVKHIEYSFDSFTWSRSGDAVFNFARSWSLAPHRQKAFESVVVDLLRTDATLSERLQALTRGWSLPQDPKTSLEFRLLFAALNRDNHQSRIDSETEALDWVFHCPEDLQSEMQSWDAQHAGPLEYLLLPRQCEKLLQADHPIDVDGAVYLYGLLKLCEAGDTADDDAFGACRLALAATLVVLADSWLAQMAKEKEHVLSVVRAAIAEIASTSKGIRESRIERSRDELKFAAHAAMKLWMKNDEKALDRESAVLQLLTSGSSAAASSIVEIAYRHRKQLSSSWWRLLQAGTLWSGLTLLSPRYGDDAGSERTWGIWLRRLRAFPLRTVEASIEDLKFSRVAAGCERLDFHRQMRAFKTSKDVWNREPERHTGTGLSSTFLKVLFGWLIDGPGTGDWSDDSRLTKRLWTYEVERAKVRAREERGESDLPSDLGYQVLQKLAELSIAAPPADAQSIWEPVLRHGPAAHYAIGHFTSCFFLRLSKGDDANAFERVWRAMMEYALEAAANSNNGRLWFYRESSLCTLLGFGNAGALLKLNAGAALRMHDIYQKWAAGHLGVVEESLAKFCYFLSSDFGAPLRLSSLSWISSALKGNSSTGKWHRDSTGEALIELINTALNQNSQALSKNSHARDALVEITGTLVARNISIALALQERIRLLR
ncbi:MAG TPA: hypothetical protein VE934_08815 [Polaromonas sp.]|uniref:hypothetical protein n=1 Tax=Polaromonas sp. TaxID=1869339 RepID=UPI002D2DB5B7|nr:hypothetical protein [Polaromonas sp.]HYW57050.1 hypothetical protein [Polaromonas sp.]